MRILSDKIQRAKKSYPCDASHTWLDSSYRQIDVSADDWLIVQGAKADKWKIIAGQEYRKVVYIYGGDLMTYRARLDMDSLCTRLKFFDEY